MIGVDDLVTSTDGWPTFELECRDDDETDPAEVTIYDARQGDLTTSWISAPLDDAVSLEQTA